MTQRAATKVHGWVALVLWAILILAGIVAKRLYGQPDWMVFFHLPAAVMLVMAFGVLSRDVRAKYREELKRVTAKHRERYTASTKKDSSPHL
jgi:ABC-type transport system involved in cytochrome c biogenesis permease subunit